MSRLPRALYTAKYQEFCEFEFVPLFLSVRSCIFGLSPAAMHLAVYTLPPTSASRAGQLLGLMCTSRRAAHPDSCYQTLRGLLDSCVICNLLANNNKVDIPSYQHPKFFPPKISFQDSPDRIGRVEVTPGEKWLALGG